MKVEILNENDEVMCTVTLNSEGRAVWEGEISLEGERIFEVATGVLVTPKQGDRFMRALPDNYRSPYLRAVLKEDE